MPITAAPNRKTRSRRLMRSDRSRAKVIAVKSSAAVVKRTAEYASGWKPWSRTYFVSVKLMLQMTMVTRSPTSAADRRRTAADASDTLGRGRGHPRRHRHARRAGDAALRVPAPRSSRGAGEGPPGRPRGPPLRRREDGAARPARPRVLSRRGGARGASDEGRLGNDPERGSSVRPPASARLIDSVLVTGGSRGIGKAIALRFAARGAKRVAIGYLRNDKAAEETADELRAAGAEPVLVRGNVTSDRVLEEVAALGHLVARRAAGARELRARGDVQGGPRVARPLPRGRARAERDPRQRRVGRRRRDRRAEALSEPRGDARAQHETNAGRSARRAGRRRRRRRVPLLAGGEDGLRADVDRRRRLLPSRLAVSEPVRCQAPAVSRQDIASHVCVPSDPNEACPVPGTGQGRKERYRRRVEPTDENRSAFDAAHRGVERREAALPALVRESLADLNGKRVLHLGAGTGAATVEFVELGATVTGVDPSDGALAVARERGPSVLWIHSEIASLPGELQRHRFDLVYAGPETTQNVRDLDRFAATVAS